MPFISYFILISVLIGNFSYFVLRRLRFFALMSELPQVAHTQKRHRVHFGISPLETDHIFF